MKLKIKVKMANPERNKKPQVIEKGDWIDLFNQSLVKPGPPKSTRKGVMFDTFDSDLQIAMKLPDGYEAICVVRSSTFRKYGFILQNQMAVIDNSYSGDTDYWHCLGISLTGKTIPAGERILQFRIQLSQKATIWQRIKNLFYDGVELEFVDKLDSKNRGGIGSTGSN